MKIKWFFFMLLLLSSCSGNVLVSTKYCKAPFADWEYQSTRPYDFVFEEKIWTLSSWENQPKEKLVRDILESHGVECFSLEDLSIEVTQKIPDIILSTVPFIARTTVIVKGHIADKDILKNK